MPDVALTPPQLASRWGVKSDTVRALIANGSLRAINVAMTPDGRPSWRIMPDAIVEFENRRAAKPPAKKNRRQRRRRDNSIIEFF